MYNKYAHKTGLRMIHNIIADLMTATSKEMITALLFGVLFLLFGIFTEKNKLAKRVAILFGCIAIIVVVITFILQATPSFSIVAFSIVCIVI